MADFDDARRRALIADLLRPLLGRPVDLRPFDEVRERLKLRHLVDRGVVEVPLSSIVGTIGREREFSRAFLPREESLRGRWDGVRDLAEGNRGFDAVDLYQVGDAYFVVDGHHRVSVARALGAPTIEARVREFVTPVPLDADTDVEDLVLRGGLADFLDATGLELERPDEYLVSEADAYDRLLDHVSAHRYFLGLDLGRPVSRQEAVVSWRETVYLPMVEAIRTSGVLREFPGKTATDLYLFLMDHLHYLRQQGHPELLPSQAIDDYVDAHRERRGEGWRRLVAWIRS